MRGRTRTVVGERPLKGLFDSEPGWLPRVDPRSGVLADLLRSLESVGWVDERIDRYRDESGIREVGETIHKSLSERFDEYVECSISIVSTGAEVEAVHDV